MTISEAYKNLINKEALEVIINNSNLCKWAANELKLAGYIPNQKDNPNSWIYEQVMEALAVFTSHGNSGSSAPFEIGLVKNLCGYKPITPLTFKDNEFTKIGEDFYQNKRCFSIFKYEYGITYNDAFAKKPILTKRYNSLGFESNKHPGYWSGKFYIVDNDRFTGQCLKHVCFKRDDIEKGIIPPKTIIIDCSEIEIEPDNWIMIVDKCNYQLKELEKTYNVRYFESKAIKDISINYPYLAEIIDLSDKELKIGKYAKSK